MGTRVVTMMWPCCPLSLLLLLSLTMTSPSQQKMINNYQPEEREAWPPLDTSYTGYVVKRQNFPDNINHNQRCALHRYTLMELHQMMEEEVRVFKKCLTEVEEDKK